MIIINIIARKKCKYGRTYTTDKPLAADLTSFLFLLLVGLFSRCHKLALVIFININKAYIHNE